MLTVSLSLGLSTYLLVQVPHTLTQREGGGCWICLFDKYKSLALFLR